MERNTRSKNVLKTGVSLYNNEIGIGENIWTSSSSASYLQIYRLEMTYSIDTQLKGDDLNKPHSLMSDPIIYHVNGIYQIKYC